MNLEDSTGAAPGEKVYPSSTRNSLLQEARSLLGSIYNRGVLQPFERSELEYGEVLITEKGISTPVQLSDFYSIATATEEVRQAFNEEPPHIQRVIVPAVLDQLEYNLYYDQKTTDS